MRRIEHVRIISNEVLELDSSIVKQLSLFHNHRRVCACGCWWWTIDPPSQDEDAMCERCERNLHTRLEKLNAKV